MHDINRFMQLTTISIELIKARTDIRVLVLKHIFNLSLSQKYFPTSWKQAAIVPVLKKGSSASVSDYRPISLLNNFSKLLEFGTASINLNLPSPVW
jgi:hypothetical protein